MSISRSFLKIRTCPKNQDFVSPDLKKNRCNGCNETVNQSISPVIVTPWEQGCWRFTQLILALFTFTNCTILKYPKLTGNRNQSSGNFSINNETKVYDTIEFLLINWFLKFCICPCDATSLIIFKKSWCWCCSCMTNNNAICEASLQIEFPFDTSCSINDHFYGKY